jgi:alkanesulfonate monooxygenase SsuD/methylene tetrahydromethanopterin reductase-like flavin-dependent oxidoreductase (luciferase family)
VQDVAAVPAMAVAIEATDSINIGARVFCVDYRQPVMFAKELATLAFFAEGRLEIGIGAGWLQGEYEAMGVTWDRAGVPLLNNSDTLVRVRDATLAFVGLADLLMAHREVEAARRELPSGALEVWIVNEPELADRLNADGLSVTQATLSRDLVELDAVKVRSTSGALVYAVPGEGGDRTPVVARESAASEARLARLCSELIVSADSSVNLCVLRTPLSRSRRSAASSNTACLSAAPTSSSTWLAGSSEESSVTDGARDRRCAGPSRSSHPHRRRGL